MNAATVEVRLADTAEVRQLIRSVERARDDIERMALHRLTCFDAPDRDNLLTIVDRLNDALDAVGGE